MIVSNSALDMRSVVVHVLSEALNRYSGFVRLAAGACVWYRYFLSVCVSEFVFVCLCASYCFYPPVCMTICLSDLTRQISVNLHARPCLSAHFSIESLRKTFLRGDERPSMPTSAPAPCILPLSIALNTHNHHLINLLRNTHCTHRLEATFGASCQDGERMDLQSSTCSLIGVCAQKLEAEEMAALTGTHTPEHTL
jgi:hypothetical protein